MSAWRDMLAPIIAGVIQEVGTEDEKALKKALREARPFAVERLSWPKKVWYDEIQRQLGKKLPVGASPVQRKQFYRCESTGDLFGALTK